MMRFSLFLMVFLAALTFSSNDSQAKGFVRIIERMFPSKRVNVEDTTFHDQKDNPTTQEGFFDKFGKDSFDSSVRKMASEKSTHESEMTEDSEETESDDSVSDNLFDNEGEESLSQSDSGHSRRSALVMALISEKNVMKLGLRTFNQNCGECHGSFLTRSSFRKRNKKTFKVLPKVDLQQIPYRFANSEEVIKNHLTYGLKDSPSHKFPKLSDAELHAVTRFVMSLN